ncbi:hypothetical protein V6N12_047247 [Hibiscus sabdariffa]|uniref:Uncharacterized protein n=1 Tax=Hibiscus sabdariffa TaxID=183260 RepID=A0ABR2DAA9_9ROSI
MADSPQALTSSSASTGRVNGKPPDEIFVVEDMVMDRPRSPSVEDVQQQSKKGRSSESSDQIQETALNDSATDIAAMPIRDPKPLFRDMLIGNNSDSLEKKRLTDLDVEVSKDDMRFRDDGPVHEIMFSNRGSITVAVNKQLPRLAGSRFAALSEGQDVEILVEEEGSIGTLLDQDKWGVASGILDVSHARVMSPAETNNRPDDSVVNKGKPVAVSAMVASRDKVFPVSTSLNKENHVVVQIDKLGGESSISGKAGRISSKVSIVTDSKGGSRGILRSKELDQSKGVIARPADGEDTLKDNYDAPIQWCDNETFDNQISDAMHD